MAKKELISPAWLGFSVFENSKKTLALTPIDLFPLTFLSEPFVEATFDRLFLYVLPFVVVG